MKFTLALILLGAITQVEAAEGDVPSLRSPRLLERGVRGRLLEDKRRRSGAVNYVCGKDNGKTGKSGGKSGKSGKDGRRLGDGCDYGDPYDDPVDNSSSVDADPTFSPVFEPVGALTGPDDPVTAAPTPDPFQASGSNTGDSADVDYDRYVKSYSNDAEDVTDVGTGTGASDLVLPPVDDPSNDP